MVIRFLVIDGGKIRKKPKIMTVFLKKL